VNLYSLSLPGLDVRSDWRAVQDRLLDDFPAIDDVLPTTTPATILIVYEGSAEIDGWLDSIDEAILSRRLRSAVRPSVRENTRLRV
jgi:hypothetical protein